MSNELEPGAPRRMSRRKVIRRGVATTAAAILGGLSFALKTRHEQRHRQLEAGSASLERSGKARPDKARRS